MKRKLRYILIFCVLQLFGGNKGFAQQLNVIPEKIILDEEKPLSFPVVQNGNAANLVYSAGEDIAVSRAIQDLQRDIKSVTDVQPVILTGNPSENPYEIIIGTIGKNTYIDRLIASGKIKSQDLKGKWESFVITTIDDAELGKKLIIAGSDRRGTVYGIYELSEQLGVSPWYFWADVPVRKRKNAFVKSGYFASGEPKVKYRGIFINDENPTMQNWAKEKFGGMNSKMYAQVFELLLRLRANYLWPGMWGNFQEYKPLVPKMKDENGNWLGNSFNEDDPLNPKLAHEYGIVIGTSHHEPMQRSQQEWLRNKQNYGNGHWNYQTNEAGIRKFFTEGIENTKNYESLITTGMRGEDDIEMADAGGFDANLKLLEKIIADQRKIIQKVTGKPAQKTPQVWTLYKEVLDYYDAGLKVPDDVIIMLCDDNWGDVTRLPELNQKKHPGGYGMYYHLGYYGGPRASKFLNITQISQMWEQLQLTYNYGVDKIWMVNVGHLKPNEYPMDFFMRMAWNPDRFKADNLQNYAEEFASEIFGENQAKEAAKLLTGYTKFASRVFPEMLDETTYNLENGEFLEAKNEILALEAKALRQYLTLPENARTAYFELILFPVQAYANLYEMYYALAMNKKRAAENDVKANDFADEVEKYFKRDAILVQQYNELENGKWNHLIDQVHIGYKSWFPPEFNIQPKVIRISSDKNTPGGYIFEEKKGVVSMEAVHYFKTENTPKTEWKIIPEMGRTNAGLGLFPYTEKTEGATVSYRFKLKNQPQKIKIHFFFDVVLPFKQGGHSVKVQLGNSTAKTIGLNQDLTWKNNYSKLYPTAAARIIEKTETFEVGNSEIQTLTIQPLDPGIVLYKIVIDNGGYEETFLKMDESPYEKN